MCVSVEASFGVAASLTPIGIYCIRRAREKDRALVALALTPLVFGVQQAAEGFVWVGIGRQDAGLTHAASAVYLFFALAFWLFWVPFAAIPLASGSSARGWLWALASVGFAAGAGFYSSILLEPESLTVSVQWHSIRYELVEYGIFEWVPGPAWQLGYLGVVSLPFLLAARTRRALTALSLGIVVSAVISHALYWYAFLSVWCFSAAILSLMLAFTFHTLPERVERLDLAASGS